MKLGPAPPRCCRLNGCTTLFCHQMFDIWNPGGGLKRNAAMDILAHMMDIVLILEVYAQEWKSGYVLGSFSFFFF